MIIIPSKFGIKKVIVVWTHFERCCKSINIHYLVAIVLRLEKKLWVFWCYFWRLFSNTWLLFYNNLEADVTRRLINKTAFRSFHWKAQLEHVIRRYFPRIYLTKLSIKFLILVYCYNYLIQWLQAHSEVRIELS